MSAIKRNVASALKKARKGARSVLKKLNELATKGINNNRNSNYLKVNLIGNITFDLTNSLFNLAGAQFGIVSKI